VRIVQWRIGLQAGRQVRVGNERYAKGHRIGLAAGQPGIRAVLGETFVGDVRTTERGLQLWAEAVGGVLLTGADKRDAAFASSRAT